MNIDFKFLDNSVNKMLKFEASYLLKDKSTFKDMFYAYLREVGDNYIIVEQFFVKSDKNYENEQIVSIKRKLIKGNFNINNEIPLNS